MTLRNSTLVFLIKRHHGNITDICLAMKKRGFGTGNWNGVGGKVEEGETVEDAARRETLEEIDVTIKSLSKIAEITFYYSHNPAWNQLVHVYFCSEWEGMPKESDEMSPRWFSVLDIPFANMWPDDIFWLPIVLHGDLVKASFTIGTENVIEQQDVRTVSDLSTSLI